MFFDPRYATQQIQLALAAFGACLGNEVRRTAENPVVASAERELRRMLHDDEHLPSAQIDAIVRYGYHVAEMPKQAHARALGAPMPPAVSPARLIQLAASSAAQSQSQSQSQSRQRRAPAPSAIAARSAASASAAAAEPTLEHLMARYTTRMQWSAADESYLVYLPDFEPKQPLAFCATREEAEREGRELLRTLIQHYQANNWRLPKPLSAAHSDHARIIP